MTAPRYEDRGTAPAASRTFSPSAREVLIVIGAVGMIIATIYPAVQLGRFVTAAQQMERLIGPRQERVLAEHSRPVRDSLRLAQVRVAELEAQLNELRTTARERP